MAILNWIKRTFRFPTFGKVTVGGRILVDGEPYGEASEDYVEMTIDTDLFKNVTIEVKPDFKGKIIVYADSVKGNLNVDGDVNVKKDVKGNVIASGDCKITGNVHHSVRASGDLSANNIKGDVSASGNVKVTGDIHKGVRANGDVRANIIKGNVTAMGDVKITRR